MIEIILQWQTTIKLKLVHHIYEFDGIDRKEISQDPGIYVFCRTYDKKRIPLYIGKTQNLRSRIKYHLNKNPKLMDQIQKLGGTKDIIYATIEPKNGITKKIWVKRIETAFIEFAMNKHYQLLNTQETKRPIYEIISKGKKEDSSPFSPKFKSIIPLPKKAIRKKS